MSWIILSFNAEFRSARLSFANILYHYMKSLYTHLECSQCSQHFDKYQIHSYCPQCIQPLVARYDLQSHPGRNAIQNRPPNLWRYAELLPVLSPEFQITLGEGATPLLRLKNTAKHTDIHQLWLKDEGNNPNGSFKARGIGMAVSKATELGIREFCIPTAGNAGSALAAYCAAVGAQAHIYMPEVTPEVFRLDCEIMGAKVVKVKGSIRDAGLKMNTDNTDGKWWDITTLKEPFRLEGKKTMGYEIAEQMGWELPDVIIYPTGGGTGLIGIWKAFQEMLEMGWVQHIPTRMVCVQTEGCNPVVKAFKANQNVSEVYENPAETIANGLRVPKAFGDKLILKTIYESGGTALDVTEEEMLSAMNEFGRQEGIFLSPEGGAVYAAFRKLLESGFIEPYHRVVLINTGSAYKYVENLTGKM